MPRAALHPRNASRTPSESPSIPSARIRARHALSTSGSCCDDLVREFEGIEEPILVDQGVSRVETGAYEPGPDPGAALVDPVDVARPLEEEPSPPDLERVEQERSAGRAVCCGRRSAERLELRRLGREDTDKGERVPLGHDRSSLRQRLPQMLDCLAKVRPRRLVVTSVPQSGEDVGTRSGGVPAREKERDDLEALPDLRSDGEAVDDEGRLAELAHVHRGRAEWNRCRR